MLNRSRTGTTGLQMKNELAWMDQSQFKSWHQKTAPLKDNLTNFYDYGKTNITQGPKKTRILRVCRNP